MHPQTSSAQPLPRGGIDQYAIDPKASNFVVQAFSSGILGAFGHSPKIAIRDFGGEVQFTRDNGSPSDARVRLSIRADSLEVTDNIGEKDRNEMHRQMFRDVLETDRFPEIVYNCPQVSINGAANRFWATLNGELTLHGVTQPKPVSARVVINDGSLRASGEFNVRQTDYDIRPVTAAAGTIKLKDELKCTFDIVARKQE